MGDVGDNWREAKAYRADKKAADHLGLSLTDYRADLQKGLAKAKNAEKQRNMEAHIARATVQCECGKWLMSDADHSGHKVKVGRKGHKVIARKEPEILSAAPWEDFA